MHFFLLHLAFMPSENVFCPYLPATFIYRPCALASFFTMIAPFSRVAAVFTMLSTDAWWTFAFAHLGVAFSSMLAVACLGAIVAPRVCRTLLIAQNSGISARTNATVAHVGALAVYTVLTRHFATITKCT